MAALIVINCGNTTGSINSSTSSPTVPVQYNVSVGPSNNINIKCWHCGEDSEIKIINVPNDPIENYTEIIDLTKEDVTEIIDLTKEDVIEIIDLTKEDVIEIIDLTKEDNIETIDLTKEDNIETIDLTNEDNDFEEDDIHMSIIEYILQNGDRIYNNGLFDIVENNDDTRGAQYPRTTMDNCDLMQYIDGYWSPRTVCFDE